MRPGRVLTQPVLPAASGRPPWSATCCCHPAQQTPLHVCGGVVLGENGGRGRNAGAQSAFGGQRATEQGHMKWNAGQSDKGGPGHNQQVHGELYGSCFQGNTTVHAPRCTRMHVRRYDSCTECMNKHIICCCCCCCPCHSLGSTNSTAGGDSTAATALAVALPASLTSADRSASLSSSSGSSCST